MLLELIQVTLGHRDRLSRTLSSKEWQDVYEKAQKQSVAGVCLQGMSRLPKEQQPPGDLYWEWYGVAVQIQYINAKVDKQAASVWRKLKDAGLDAAILKGQGIATEYGELASLRQSGDIDVWVLGGYRKVCDFVQSTFPTDDVAYHRFHYNMFKEG